MSSTRRHDTQLFRALALAFAFALTSVFAFGLSTAEAGTKLPKITKVSPNTKVTVGKKLTISGQNFVKGKKTLIVIFKRAGSKRTFTARGDASGTTRGTVVVPDVSGDLSGDESLFRLRVITKYGAAKAWTGTSISPRVVVDAKGTAPGTGSGALPTGVSVPPTPVPVVVLDCDADGTPDGIDLDDDNDLLTDTIELSIGTDVCGKDTDGDGPDDYYEYTIAYAINGGPTLPYPKKMPYPNPIFADQSAGDDYDQDQMTTLMEYEAWKYTGLMSHFYSDADADSDNDGRLDPAEDEDGDLLPNHVEFYHFGALNWLEPDTDGDGLCDGLDDEDHDGPPTSLAEADCATSVPNNVSPGDPDSLKIDGDDNIYSNFYEWYIAGAEIHSVGDALEVCKPSTWPVSPYCGEDQPWEPLPTDGPTGGTGATGP